MLSPRRRAVAGETDALRERLARAGWSVTDLRDKTLRIRDQYMDVTRGAATKGRLLGRFVHLGSCVDGDDVDRFERLGRLVAEQRIGPAKVRVEVMDGARALEELARLTPLLSAGSFAAAIARVEEAGFRVDRDASLEDTYDTFVWEIRARRAGEHLDVGVRFGAHSLPERGGAAFLNDDGQAELRRPNAVLCVGLCSLQAAEELLAVLAPPPGR
jgi:hypothetical protein